NGLDLLAQAVQRVAVDASQQPALTPLELGDSRREMPADYESLMFQRAQPEIAVRPLESERPRQLGRGRRPDDLEPPADDLADSVFTGPGLRPFALGHRHRRIDRRAREDGLEHRD